ncbi:MAG: 6-phosphofructokinase [Anaerolineae bacterium]|nr:MAG: 6-phosphofructokinase [Anaerolineae bacterium]
MNQRPIKRIGVLTSGGDAQGMNAAVRAVIRTGLDRGLQVYAIYEGYMGMIDGGERIRPMSWNSVGGILHKGGTVIGSARCEEFRQRSGRLKAAHNLIQKGIGGLIIIGGDGSLTGAHIFRNEWPELLAELLSSGKIDSKQAELHQQLSVVGIIASIDNDFHGTDMTIGADSALHRITEALDAISSTAASHQRTFVVEVMGRRCGYLALMSALASGVDWALIPETPPNLENWEDKMCQVLKKGRQMGKRDSIVIVAEGAQDRTGNPISSDYVKNVLEEKLGEETRVTILGHVQRGGSPSAFDRNLSTMLGAAAVEAILEGGDKEDIPVIGMRGNKITQTPLSLCLFRTNEVSQAVADLDFKRALKKRGGSFEEAFRTFRTLLRAQPHEPDTGQDKYRLGIMNAGAPAPGMNTAVRAATRLGIDRGHTLLGIYNGFQGLVDGQIEELDWMSVNGWAHRGGAELGTNRKIPVESDFYSIARNIEEHEINGLLMIGGWSGYEAILELHHRRFDFPTFDIPMVCLPATIDNDLPGSELSIGADTALNNIVSSVDKIKQSAVASRRAFVVEVMGAYCGYLALMSALATGAERVYLPEEGVVLQDLVDDVNSLIEGFKHGKRLGMMIRNEKANETYSTGFMCALFEEEGGDLFDVRQAILGHVQQGGNPSPFDRIMATRMAALCIEYLADQLGQPGPVSACVGQKGGRLLFTDLEDIPRLMDRYLRRPKIQWWLDLRPLARVLAQPGPRKDLDR